MLLVKPDGKVFTHRFNGKSIAGSCEANFLVGKVKLEDGNLTHVRETPVKSVREVTEYILGVTYGEADSFNRRGEAHLVAAPEEGDI